MFKTIESLQLVSFPYYGVMLGDPDGHGHAGETLAHGRWYFHLEFSLEEAYQALRALTYYREDLSSGHIINVAASFGDEPGGWVQAIDRETLDWIRREVPRYAGFFTKFRYRRGHRGDPSGKLVPWDHYLTKVPGLG